MIRGKGRSHALNCARVGFLVLVLGCAWWGFDGRWSQIGDAAAAIGPVRLGAAVVCATVGLALTGVLWRMLLSTLGSMVPLRAAGAVFFVGQLGKYVPGSVWSFAAQAQLGRRHGVPARSSVTASSLFLLLHIFSGLALGGAFVAGGVLHTDLARGWWLLGAVVSAAALAPPALRIVGRRLSGIDVVAPDLLRSLALMAAVWACYGLCLWILLPSANVLAAGAAFALAHAAGVLLVFAPAGLGAREAVLIALLSPAVGVPSAAAAALLARVAHSIADFVLAAGAALWARGHAVRGDSVREAVHVDHA